VVTIDKLCYRRSRSTASTDDPRAPPLGLEKIIQTFERNDQRRRKMNERIRLEIKLNNAATNDPCRLCGKRTDPECGPELFLGGTWAKVCYECGAEHAEELMECLAVYRESPEFLRRNGVEVDALRMERVKALRHLQCNAIMEADRVRRLASGVDSGPQGDEEEFQMDELQAQRVKALRRRQCNTIMDEGEIPF
jgi:hypothetical protein